MKKINLDLPAKGELAMTMRRLGFRLEKKFEEQNERNRQYKNEILKAIEDYKKRIDDRMVALKEKLTS